MSIAMIKYMFLALATAVLFTSEAIAATPTKELSTIGSFYSSASSRLCSPSMGRVESVFVETGDAVKKGQALVKLNTSLLEIEVAHKKALLDAAAIDANDAETNFQRMHKLWEKPEGESPSISQKRFEDAKLRSEQTRALVRQAQEELNREQVKLDEATIKAAFDGVITKRFVDPGACVTGAPDTPLVEIQAINPIYLEFAIPQVNLHYVQPGMPIVFTVEGMEAGDSATIARIFPCIDASTRSARCRAIIGNSEGKFRPGSLVKVEVKSP